MKSTVTHSKSAVPSILTVAPRGNTKLLIRLLIPASSFAVSMVTPRVPELEAVEKPVRRAVRKRKKIQS